MKDKLRAATLGANVTFKRETVIIEGETFELVQPTLQQRGDIRGKAMKLKLKDAKDKEGDSTMDFDINEFQLHAVIALTKVPGTDENVFDLTDLETMRGLPCGSWFDQLAKVATELCNVTSEEVKKD